MGTTPTRARRAAPADRGLGAGPARARPRARRAGYAGGVRRGGGRAGGGAQARRRGLGRPARAALAAVFALGCALLAPPRPLPPELLDALAARAEAARGLRFEGPVGAVFVPPEGLHGVLARELDAGYGRADFQRAEAVGEALGLWPAGLDLREAVLELQTRSVAGFYTPLRRRLVLVLEEPPAAAGLAPRLEAVAVHELVHALQDAHSPLLAVLLGLDDHDDLAFAIGAVLEGDALLAAFRDRAAQGGGPPPSPEAFAGELGDAPGDASLPRFLRDALLLQYPLGYAAATALEAKGGRAALDAALREPPLSSEALLHPRPDGTPAAAPLPWLDLEGAALEPAGCRALGSNAFGELGLRAFARERGASEARARSAAAGWDGDRALALACAEGSASVWLAQFDAEVDALEFAAVAQASRRPGEVVERAGRRVLLAHRLPPGARRAALAAPEARHADLAAYLAARPQVLARADRLRRAAAWGGRPAGVGGR